MTIVYQKEHPNYGWLYYPTIDAVLDDIEVDIECMMRTDEITIVIKSVEMTQEEIDAIPALTRNRDARSDAEEG